MTDGVHTTWRILVVDDEPDVCRSIARYLGREGFEVDTVADGDAMYTVLANTKIDLIVLDLRLPGKDGLTLARELRQSSAIPIIMLTAKDDVIDRGRGAGVRRRRLCSQTFSSSGTAGPNTRRAAPFDFRSRPEDQQERALAAELRRLAPALRFAPIALAARPGSASIARGIRSALYFSATPQSRP